MPLNDGFGGWVYWGAVARLGIARVEIAPGASSALFGSSAVGGAVEIVSRAVVDRAEVELEGGGFRTGEAALSLGKRGDKLAASLDLEGLGTAGYQVVASPGLVDHAASSRRVSERPRLEARLAPEVTAFARVGGFGESEESGTRYTTASAREAEVVAGVTAGSFDLKAFARQARFDQDRARLLPDAFARASEQLASSQAAPADDEGLSLQYASGGLVAGLDARRVFGRSQEALHPAPLSAAAVIARNASGEQQQAGIFVEEVLSPSSRRSGE